MPMGVYQHKLTQGFQKGNKSRTGKKNSKEHRQKIGNALKGKKRNCPVWNKGRKEIRLEVLQRQSKSHLGYKVSEKTREKLSEANKGNKCHFWKGGITPENLRIKNSIEYRLWREAVFARDNWVCQKCGDNKGGNLNSHHIQNFAQFPECRFAIDNGITFCDKCHNKFHKKYGTKNNTKKQLGEFLNKNI